MDRKSKDGMPRYQQIALDIATQIVKQQYKVGTASTRVPRWQASTMFRLKPPAGPSAFWRIWTLWRWKRAAAW